MSDIEIIPAAQPINSERVNEARIINTTTSLRDRRQEPVVIPPPPIDERVEVQRVQRRSFIAPEISAPEQVFRPTRR